MWKKAKQPALNETAQWFNATGADLIKEKVRKYGNQGLGEIYLINLDFYIPYEVELKELAPMISKMICPARYVNDQTGEDILLFVN